MRRCLPLLAGLLLLAGCDGGAALPPGVSATLKAGFPPGGIADTIVVEAIDRLPLRAAVLVAPDGALSPAGAVDVAASPGFATGQWTAANPWQNSIAPGSALPLPASQRAPAGAALRAHEELLATVSRADIPLPDPVAYRRDWARYRIRLTFGTSPGEVETREIAAPQPPPR
jgi:hypothetical protein